MIAREIERLGIPTALITAMTMMAQQTGANHIVSGTKIPHPCGDPNLSAEDDLKLRKEILKTALKLLETKTEGQTTVVPDIEFMTG